MTSRIIEEYSSERMLLSKYITMLNLRHTFSLRYYVKHEILDSGRKYSRVFCDIAQVHVCYNSDKEELEEVDSLRAVVELCNSGDDHRSDDQWRSGDVNDNEVYILCAPARYNAEQEYNNLDCKQPL